LTNLMLPPSSDGGVINFEWGGNSPIVTPTSPSSMPVAGLTSLGSPKAGVMAHQDVVDPTGVVTRYEIVDVYVLQPAVGSLPTIKDVTILSPKVRGGGGGWTRSGVEQGGAEPEGGGRSTTSELLLSLFVFATLFSTSRTLHLSPPPLAPPPPRRPPRAFSSRHLAEESATPSTRGSQTTGRGCRAEGTPRS
jgi:hypothetical protein